MKKLIALSTGLLAAFGTQALAQDAFPTSPPAITKAPKNFNLPDIETYELRNGVAVTLVPYGNVPKVNLQAEFMTGSIDEGEDAYLAELTGSMMSEGAGGMTAAEMAEAAAMMGGSLNVGIGTNTSTISIDVLSSHADEAIAMMGAVAADPTFPESELERIKANAVRGLSVERTQPGSMATEAFRAVLYPDHPYAEGIAPDDKVMAYTVEDMAAFHKANFTGDRLHVYVVGQFDRSAMRRAIKDAFGGLPKGKPATQIPSPPNDEAQNVMIDRDGASQTTIRFGKRVPALDGSVEIEAMDTLLGGYFSSRMTKNLREDKGYTYSPSSTVSNRKGAANWQQNADIQTQSTGPAMEEIIKEIIRLQNETPTQEELTGVQNYMGGIYVIQLASRSGMSGWLQYVDLHDLGVEYIETYVAKVRAVTPEEVRAAAFKHLDLRDMTLVIVGDLDEVRPQLEKLPLLSGRLPDAQ